MKTALLIDGAFVRKKFRSSLKKDITSSDIQRMIERVFRALSLTAEQYRVYFYDCPPCSEKTSLLISHSAHDFEKTPQYANGSFCLRKMHIEAGGTRGLIGELKPATGC